MNHHERREYQEDRRWLASRRTREGRSAAAESGDRIAQAYSARMGRVRAETERHDVATENATTATRRKKGAEK